MNQCIFCKIRDKEIEKDFIYEDEDVMVFPDIHPLKPIHLLIIPKTHIGDFLFITEKGLMEKMSLVLQKLIKEYSLEDKGYKITINGGGAQMIDHLHIHLMGPLGKQVAE